MKISELAKSTDCHVETVRYYVNEGLLPPAKKLHNGYGEYSEHHLVVLTLIRHAKQLGFSQTRIRELVFLATESNRPCNDVHKLTLNHLEIVNQKIDELHQIKESLKRLVSICRDNIEENCPALNQLATRNKKTID